MTTTVRSRRGDEKFTYADYLTWPEDERWEASRATPGPGTGSSAGRRKRGKP